MVNPVGAPYSRRLSGEGSFYAPNKYRYSVDTFFFGNKSASVYQLYFPENRTKAKKLTLHIHILAGKIIIPASCPRLIGYKKEYATLTRICIKLNGDWVFDRITIMVNGKPLDLVVMGKASTFTNGRWSLVSLGNAQFYEEILSGYNESFKKILSFLKLNALILNYPGVGDSSGYATVKSMTNSYKAALDFVIAEIGAETLIPFGHSMGVFPQVEAFNQIELEKLKGVQCLLIQDRSFSSLAKAAAALYGEPAGWAVKATRWNVKPAKFLKSDKIPRLILQTAKAKHYTEVFDPSKVIDDGMICPEASLAVHVLKELTPQNCKVIATHETHNQPFLDPRRLSLKIKEELGEMKELKFSK